MVKKRNGIIIILLVSLLLYSNSFFNGFVWDDEEQIVGNTLMHSLGNLPKFFGGGSFNTGGTGNLSGGYYRPLMTTTFSLIYSFFGGGSFFFHFIQTIIFTFGVIMFYLFLSELFSEKRKDYSFLTLSLSLILLVHPFTSEVVFYAANIQDALFFAFGTTYLYIFLTKSKNWLLTLLALSALLSKETAILFFLVTIFMIIFFKKNIASGLKSWGAATMAYLIMRFGLAHMGFGVKNINVFFSMSLWERLMSTPKIIFSAILGFFYPSQKLISLNQHWFVKTLNLQEFYLPLALLIVAFGLLIYLGLKLKDKIYWLFLFWVVIGLGINSQIVALDVTTSGRLYLFALCGVLGVAGVIATHIKNLKYLNYFLIATAVAFSVITFIRSFDFRNGLSLYSHEVKYQTGNYNLDNNLGVELYRKGDFENARIYFEKSISDNPNWWTAYSNLGAYWQGKGNLVKAESFYKTSLEKGNFYLAMENYAIVLYQQKKWDDLGTFLRMYLPLYPQNRVLNAAWAAYQEVETANK